jgi:bifunctional DNase/RNase
MFEMIVDQVKSSPHNYQRVVVLKVKEANKYLPIWISPAEADSIALKLKNHEVPRPLTHDLMDSVISDLGAKVTQVVVSELKEETFYAKVVMQRNDTTIERATLLP